MGKVQDYWPGIVTGSVGIGLVGFVEVLSWTWQGLVLMVLACVALVGLVLAWLVLNSYLLGWLVLAGLVLTWLVLGWRLMA